MKKLLFIGILLMGLSLQGWTQEKTITVTGIVTDTWCKHLCAKYAGVGCHHRYQWKVPD